MSAAKRGLTPFALCSHRCVRWQLALPRHQAKSPFIFSSLPLDNDFPSLVMAIPMWWNFQAMAGRWLLRSRVSKGKAQEWGAGRWVGALRRGALQRLSQVSSFSSPPALGHLSQTTQGSFLCVSPLPGCLQRVLQQHLSRAEELSAGVACAEVWAQLLRTLRRRARIPGYMWPPHLDCSCGFLRDGGRKGWTLH